MTWNQAGLECAETHLLLSPSAEVEGVCRAAVPSPACLCLINVPFPQLGIILSLLQGSCANEMRCSAFWMVVGHTSKLKALDHEYSTTRLEWIWIKHPSVIWLASPVLDHTEETWE